MLARLQKAIFDRADLRGANLSGANLQGAHLERTQLQEAHLNRANLQEAMLWDAQLQYAILDGANLQKASLPKAQLQKASLILAQLQEASLTGADLQGANLAVTRLQRARLDHANLQEANLDHANLEEVNLDQARLTDARRGLVVGEADASPSTLASYGMGDGLSVDLGSLTRLILYQSARPELGGTQMELSGRPQDHASRLSPIRLGLVTTAAPCRQGASPTVLAPRRPASREGRVPVSPTCMYSCQAWTRSAFGRVALQARAPLRRARRQPTW
jgi:Pentapeptide repeats (8 copies)